MDLTLGDSDDECAGELASAAQWKKRRTSDRIRSAAAAAAVVVSPAVSPAPRGRSSRGKAKASPATSPPPRERSSKGKAKAAAVRASVVPDTSELAASLFGESGCAIRTARGGSGLSALFTVGGVRVGCTDLGSGAHATVYTLRGARCEGLVAKWAEPLAPKDMDAANVGQPQKAKTWRETHVHGRIATPLLRLGGCPHFPELHGWYTAGQRAVMIMERGECSLAEWAQGGKRSEREWLVVLFQLYHALAALQHFDVVHYDIKWGNVLMRRTGSPGGYVAYEAGGETFHVPDIGWQALLCDFGLAHVCNPCYEPAFYNDRGRKRGGWMAVYGCDRSRLSTDGACVEIDGQLVAERSLGSAEVRMRARGAGPGGEVCHAVGSAALARAASGTFANDRRSDTRELARSFEPGGLVIDAIANMGKQHFDHGVMMPAKVLKICRAVYRVDTSKGSTTRRDAVHFCAERVLTQLLGDVFPATRKGAPRAVYNYARVQV